MGRRQGVRREHPAPVYRVVEQTKVDTNVKLVRDATDEQRSRRPIFIATLWAGASWLFFRVARSLRIDSRYARRNRQSGSDRLEKQPTDLRRNICLFRGQDTSSANSTE